MGISLIGRHVATEQSGLPRPPHNQVRFSNSSYLMEMLELRMSMLFEDASDDNDENASYIEENDEVDEREYDLAHILHPPFRCKCLLSSLQRLLPQHYPFQSCTHF